MIPIVIVIVVVIVKGRCQRDRGLRPDADQGETRTSLQHANASDDHQAEGNLGSTGGPRILSCHGAAATSKEDEKQWKGTRFLSTNTEEKVVVCDRFRNTACSCLRHFEVSSW